MSLLDHELELLAPAKTADIGREAILHGAEAVYIGGPAFGARHNASNPIEAIFSEIWSCSSSCTRAEMSSTITIVPAIAPSESRSGVVATFTSSRRDWSWRVVSGTR